MIETQSPLGTMLVPTREAVRRFHPSALGLHYPGVPDHVAVSSLCAVVPAPPKLAADATLAMGVLLLAQWYTGAVEATTRRMCWTFRRQKRGLESSPHYRVLCEAVPTLGEHEIAPAAWCGFSCDVWRTYHTGAPPVPWVYSVKRIVERRAWFRSEAGDYGGGRVILTRSARRLMTLQAAMRTTIACLCPDDAALARIVDYYFPDDLHAELVKLTKAEANVQRRVLAKQIEEGGWPWA